MGGPKGGGSAPAAPDPVATSNAQAEAYIKSARESSKLNNIYQMTPYGNVTFDKDASGVPIGQRVTLTPEQQSAFDAQTGLQGTLSGAAAQLASSVPVGPFGLPTDLPPYTVGLDMTGAPNVPGINDFSADRKAMSQAMYDQAYDLMRPEFETNASRTRQMLSDRGFGIDSDPYKGEIDRLERSQGAQLNQLANQAVAAGAGEQSRLFGLSSQARQQITGEQLANAGLGQGARNAMIQEALLQYNAPAQGVATLLGASPKTPTVQGGNIFTAGVGAPDVQGNIWNSYNAQLQNWQQKQQQSNAMWQGIGSLAGSIGSMFMSDKDKKRGFKPANSILNRVEKIPIKSWRYKGAYDDGLPHVGPTAQDFKGFFGLGTGMAIPAVDAAGVNLAATQQLARKVKKLERRAA